MIDLDRGVQKRKHPGGFQVCMYKDQPGVFFDTSGQPVTPETAGEAGFNVTSLRKEQEKRAKLAKVREEIEREFAQQEAAAQDVLAANAEGKSFHVKHVGGGVFGIYDNEGNRVTRQKMGKAEAEKLLQTMGVPIAKEDDEAA